MLFYLSCLLKASLSFIILTKFISGFTVDTSLVVFVSLQIILLDYIIFKDNDIPVKRISFSFSYLKKLERYIFLWPGLFASIVPVSVLSLFCGSLFFFVSPLYSHEHIVIPDLKGLKQYSADTNFMSFDGYLISYFKIKYNKDISRGEARKIIKDALKNKSEYVIAANDKAIAKINSVNIGGADNFEKKYNECIIKLQNTIQSMRIINGSVKRHATEMMPAAHAPVIKRYNAGPAAKCPETHGKAGSLKQSSLAVQSSKSELINAKEVKKIEMSVCSAQAKPKCGTKRAVLLPFKNKAKKGGASGSITTSEENAVYSIKNYLSYKGFSVISGADVAGVCFNLDNLDKSTINELAARFGADYIVTGSIDADANAYLKVIDASNHKIYNSFDCLN